MAHRANYFDGGAKVTSHDLEKLPLFESKGIAEDAVSNNTQAYIWQCFTLCFAGDYGKIPPEDAAANNKELETGEGHIIAIYPEAYDFREDLLIEFFFSESKPGEENNRGIIMYPSER